MDESSELKTYKTTGQALQPPSDFDQSPRAVPIPPRDNGPRARTMESKGNVGVLERGQLDQSSGLGLGDEVRPITVDLTKTQRSLTPSLGSRILEDSNRQYVKKHKRIKKTQSPVISKARGGKYGAEDILTQALTRVDRRQPKYRPSKRVPDGESMKAFLIGLAMSENEAKPKGLSSDSNLEAPAFVMSGDEANPGLDDQTLVVDPDLAKDSLDTVAGSINILHPPSVKPEVLSPGLVPRHIKLSPRIVETVESHALDPPANQKEKAFSVPRNLRVLSGLIWGKLGPQDAIWHPSGTVFPNNREQIQGAVVSFREMREKESIKSRQFMTAIESNCPPAKFQLFRPRVLPLKHSHEVLGIAEDDYDSAFLSERASKLKMILLLLQLLTWREAACRLGRESSISSSILEFGGSEESTAVDNDDTTQLPSGKGNGASGSDEHTPSASLQRDGSTTLEKSRDIGNHQEMKRDNKGDDDEDKPPTKRRKKNPERPIGRRDLSDVKEHLRRNHFNKTTPPGLLSARSWNEIFDFCYPLWKPRPYPSPYVYTAEILFNCIRWNNPQPEAQPEDILLDYQRIDSPMGPSVNVAGLIKFATDTEEIRNPKPILQTKSNTDLIFGLLEQDASINSQNQLDNIAISGDHALGAYISYPDPTNQSREPSFDILEPSTSIPYGHQNIEHWNETTGISASLSAAISKMAEPHFTWPLPSEAQTQAAEFTHFLSSGLGIDLSLPPEDCYNQVLSSIDSGNIFDPATGFTMPLINPMPLSLSSTSFPHPKLKVFEAETLIPFQPLYMAFPGAPPDGGSGPESDDSNPSTIASDIPPTLPRVQPLQQKNRDTALEKYLLLVSRRPIDVNSTEGNGYKRYEFNGFEDFRENFDEWLKSKFTDPPFDWTLMEFYNELREARLTDIEEVIDDLEGSFTHYRSTKASLYLVMKDKGKQRWRRVSSRASAV
ncbi:hypothetical protein EYR41_010426 [Orbilia oligospora]|uniref:Uncharacterized protein n=1 Tax=Orbilia oligospora TaxID=2813651 RepID=A0A8H2HK31_ORBOL|nr:hypothetical protein EYR41_010426 [Orbilia oligospora]